MFMEKRFLKVYRGILCFSIKIFDGECIVVNVTLIPYDLKYPGISQFDARSTRINKIR